MPVEMARKTHWKFEQSGQQEDLCRVVPILFHSDGNFLHDI